MCDAAEKMIAETDEDIFTMLAKEKRLVTLKKKYENVL
jgi:hypothetical protein